MPTNLPDLADSSILIIDGTVGELVVPRVLGFHNLETDAVISITTVLKGSQSLQRITVAQRGGTIGQFTSQPTDYSMMKLGERYILFLTEEKRPNLPQVSVAPRYAITGAWAGLFRVDQQGKMVVKFSGPQGLLKYNGMAVSALVGELSKAIMP
jgi:hypothetical protein